MKVHLILTEEGGLRIFLRPGQGPSQKKELEALKWFLETNFIKPPLNSTREISLQLSEDLPGCAGDVSGIRLQTFRFGVGKFSLYADMRLEKVRIPKIKKKKKEEKK